MTSNKLPDYFEVQKNETSDTIQYVALEITLHQAMLDPTKNFIIFADRIHLPSKGKLSLPGKDIELYARVILANGCTIDTSGGDAKTSFKAGDLPSPSPANSGSKPGATGDPGTPGDKGSPGENAGNITLVAEYVEFDLTLVANGGTGGRGQDGGVGGQGAHGKEGDDAVIGQEGLDDVIEKQPTHGKQGGHGGQGGKAGASGAGGNGGKILVTAKDHNAIQVAVNYGPAGDAASPGEGGNPGPGGIGGRHASCRYICDINDDCQNYCSLTVTRAPTGPHGSKGQDGPSAVPATHGKIGTYHVVPVTDFSDYYKKYPFSLPQRVLTLHAAQLYYLAGEYQNAHKLYLWLQRVTPATISIAGSMENAEELVNLNQRVSALINQLMHGLDYYGNPHNHVPIVSLDYYQTQLTDMLLLAKDIEATYDEYEAKQNDLTKQKTAFEHALKRAQDSINNLKTSLGNAQNQKKQFSKDIEKLTNDLINQQQVLQSSEQSFKTAVEKENHVPNCSFGDILTALTSVVLIGANAYNLFGDIAAIGALVGEEATWANYIKKIEKVTKGIADMQSKWKNIQGLVKPNSQDAGKLVMEKDNFDKVIQPFLILPEAQDYQKQVHDYFGIIQSRNAKVVKYNAVMIQSEQLTATIAQKVAALNRIKGAWADKQEPALSANRTFMVSVYRDIKEHLLTYLYNENQAFNYWSLTDNPFNAGDQTVAELSSFHTQIQEKITQYMSGTLAPPQSFQHAKISIDAASRPEQFQNFIKTGRIMFSVLLNDPNANFLGYTEVTATHVSISIQGAQTSNDCLYIMMTQNGDSAFLDRSGKRIDFTHDRREAVYSYIVSDGTVKVNGNLGGDDGKYIGVSPFATWTLELPSEYNPGLDLTDVKKIEISFKGRMTPPDTVRKPAGTILPYILDLWKQILAALGFGKHQV